MDINSLKEKLGAFLKKVGNCFVLITKGEFNFKYMMYLWGVLPGFIICFFLQKYIELMQDKFALLAFLLCLVIIVYFLWHLMYLYKTLKVHPEYRVLKKTKKELYKDKTPDEIKELKKKERQETIKKLLLLEKWDSAPAYILVGVFDLCVILTELQLIFAIIG